MHIQEDNSNHVDIRTKPGGILVFDGHVYHEVLPVDEEFVIHETTDGHGKYLKDRKSFVLMCNRQDGFEFMLPTDVSNQLSANAKNRMKGKKRRK